MFPLGICISHGLGRPFMMKPGIKERCKEVQAMQETEERSRCWTDSTPLHVTGLIKDFFSNAQNPGEPSGTVGLPS
jgi:hypothetical protein